MIYRNDYKMMYKFYHKMEIKVTIREDIDDIVKLILI